jgi:predicted dehydrogenase
VTQPLRAAIIGPGRIASTYDDEVPVHREAEFFQGEHRHPGLYTVHPINHAAAYRAIPEYDLVAVVGRGAERLAAFKARWDVPTYTDIREMLETQRPDVVSVCTQSDAKAAVVCAIAEAGTSVRAIVVEKAMATSAAETDAMIAACEASGIQLVVDHPYRFSGQIRAAKEMVDRGEIGTLGTVSGWSGGGAIHGGTHIFDLLQFFAGPIAEVFATGPEQAEWKDGPVSGSLRFANGIVGFFSLERAAMPGIDLRGSEGRLLLSTIVGDSWLTRTSLLDPGSPRRYPLVAATVPFDPGLPERSTTEQLLLDVRDLVLTGKPVHSTGRDGATALEAGIAALISARERRPVSLPIAERDLVISNR